MTDNLRVIAAVARNRRLRALGIAFVGFNIGEYAVWIAMLVFAYDHGGATTAGIVAAVQLVPAAIFAPLPAALPGRYPPPRVLAAGYLAPSPSVGAAAPAPFAGGAA